MTFDANSITDVAIDVSGETPGIGAAIGEQMQDAILSAQTADIDAVTGATITSDAIRKAAAACIEQASGEAVTLTEKSEAPSDWLGEAPEVAEAEITEELETEVLVVGCGTGGWIAGMTAAEEGAKVLIVEKADAPTKIKEDIGAINSKLQLESFKDFPEFEIDKIQALQDIVRYASGYVDSDLVKTWMDNSGELVDWLTNILEGTGHWFMQLEGGIGDQEHPERDKAYATGHSPHPTEDKPEDVTLNTDMQAFIEERGGEIRCNTSLVKLDVDVAAGRVTGIIAQDTTDGHYIRIKATKGTIMATGGYASNTEMMLALQPQTMKMKINVPMGSKSDGAGIKAMLWAGAQMDPCHASMMFNRCSCLPTETAGYKTNGKWFWFGEQPFLKVNLNGKRFCNESGPYEFMLHSMYMQPHHTYCDIFDANNKQYCEQFDEVGCCRLFPFDNGAISNRGYDACWKEMTEGENSHAGRHCSVLWHPHRCLAPDHPGRLPHQHQHAGHPRRRHAHPGPLGHRRLHGRFLCQQLSEPLHRSGLRPHHDLRPPRGKDGRQRRSLILTERESFSIIRQKTPRDPSRIPGYHYAEIMLWSISNEVISSLTAGCAEFRTDRGGELVLFPVQAALCLQGRAEGRTAYFVRSVNCCFRRQHVILM